MKTRLIGCEPGSLVFHTSKRSHSDTAIVRPAPGAAPMFQSQQLFRGLIDEQFDSVLITEPIAS